MVNYESATNFPHDLLSQEYILAFLIKLKENDSGNPGINIGRNQSSTIQTAPPVPYNRTRPVVWKEPRRCETAVAAKMVYDHFVTCWFLFNSDLVCMMAIEIVGGGGVE